MSFDFDMTGVEEYEDLLFPQVGGEEDWCSVTLALSHMSMLIGMNEITKTNWKEYLARCIMWEGVRGTIQNIQGNPVGIRAVDVFRHIGLKTTAKNINRGEFMKQCFNFGDDMNMAAAVQMFKEAKEIQRKFIEGVEAEQNKSKIITDI